jgi:hypothetical protein
MRIFRRAPGSGSGRKDGELFGTDVSAQASLLREHRLYQTDFLLRKYHFSSDEILFGPDGNLSLDKDPKLVGPRRILSFIPFPYARRVWTNCSVSRASVRSTPSGS